MTTQQPTTLRVGIFAGTGYVGSYLVEQLLQGVICTADDLISPGIQPGSFSAQALQYLAANGG